MDGVGFSGCFFFFFIVVVLFIVLCYIVFGWMSVFMFGSIIFL